MFSKMRMSNIPPTVDALSDIEIFRLNLDYVLYAYFIPVGIILMPLALLNLYGPQHWTGVIESLELLFIFVLTLFGAYKSQQTQIVLAIGGVFLLSQLAYQQDLMIIDVLLTLLTNVLLVMKQKAHSRQFAIIRMLQILGQRKLWYMP